MTRLRHLLWRSLFVMILTVWSRPLHAQGEPVEVDTHIYRWHGVNGLGSGSTDDWDNWSPGDMLIIPNGTDPPIIVHLPPHNGDEVSILGKSDFHYPVTIDIDGIDLPLTYFTAQIGGTLSGGALNFYSAGFGTGADGDGNALPLTVSGTSVTANQIVATATDAALNLSGVTFEGPMISLSGSKIVATAAPPTINVADSFLSALQGGNGKLNIGPYAGEWTLNTTSSFLQTDTLRMGPDVGELVLTLKGDEASVIAATNVAIAPEVGSIVRLKVHETTPHFTPTTNVLIGDKGKAYVTIDGAGQFITETTYAAKHPNSLADIQIDHAKWTTKDLYLGVSGTATVSIDGAGSEVHTKDKLYAGYGEAGMGGGEAFNGKGMITVRNGGKLKADKDAVLGENRGSQGVLNLIGANSKLELGATAKLTIGNNGKGELNLSEGATFTSAGDVSLGKNVHSTGNVTVDGENSKWEVTGRLTIGDSGKGRVEIRKQGTVTSHGGEAILGKAIGSEGTLVLDGEGSTFDFDGVVTVGEFGKGTVTLQGGADYTTQNLTLGNFAGGEGVLEINGAMSSLTRFIATGDLTAGKSGRGIVTVQSAGKLAVDGKFISGDSADSGTTDIYNLTTITGTDSAASVQGDITIGKGPRSVARVYVLSGGRLDAHGETLNIGEGLDSTGIMLVSSSDQESKVAVGGDMHIGVQGKGIVGLEAEASLEVQGNLYAGGTDTNSEGILLVDGSDTRASVRGEILIGDHGTGSVIVQRGGHMTALENIVVDSKLPDGASLKVTGKDSNGFYSFVSGKDISIAETGWGELIVTQEGFVGTPADNMYVGVQSHGIASVTIEHKGSLQAANLDVAKDGYATFQIATNGSVEVENKFSLGESIVTIDQGILTAKEITAGEGSNITVSNAGKIVIKANGSMSMYGSSAKPATLNLHSGAGVTVAESAGTSFVAGAVGKAIINIDSGGNLGTKTFALGPNQSSATVSGEGSYIDSAFLIVNAGATLTAASSAVVRVQNTATINGTVDVQGAGLMRIANAAADFVSPLGAVTVGPGGTLRGRGTIKGDLYAPDPKTFPHVTGVRKPLIAIGTSPGILTVEGNALFEEDTVLEMEIGGTAPGTQYDQLVATGSIIVNGEIDLAIVNSGGGFQLPGLSDQFTVLNAAGGLSGSIANAASLHSVAGGWLVDWSLSSTANNAVLQATAITPLTDGDYNGDGSVDAADYVVWRKMVGGINLAADGNRDGFINNLDYDVWRTHFGQGSSGGTGTTSAVPEASSLALTALALVNCALLYRRRGRL